jgi:hypothetical protein
LPAAAVSNAYYALVHLLISNFVLNWKTKGQRATLGRVFDHEKMKDTSKKISDKNVKNPNATLTALRSVTAAFVRLQQACYYADYDHGKIWSRTAAYSLSMLGPRQS